METRERSKSRQGDDNKKMKKKSIKQHPHLRYKTGTRGVDPGPDFEWHGGVLFRSGGSARAAPLWIV